MQRFLNLLLIFQNISKQLLSLKDPALFLITVNKTAFIQNIFKPLFTDYKMKKRNKNTKKRVSDLKKELSKIKSPVLNSSLEDAEKEIENIFERIRKSIHPKHHRLTSGQKAADNLTKWAGSWFFISLLFILIAIWIYLNVTAYVQHWDPWPFIILNLCLSCLAAMQAPIILMSQNRSNQRDRLRAEYDYKINKKAEKEIREVKSQLDRIEKRLSRK